MLIHTVKPTNYINNKTRIVVICLIGLFHRWLTCQSRKNKGVNNIINNNWIQCQDPGLVHAGSLSPVLFLQRQVKISAVKKAYSAVDNDLSITLLVCFTVIYQSSTLQCWEKRKACVSNWVFNTITLKDHQRCLDFSKILWTVEYLVPTSLTNDEWIHLIIIKEIFTYSKHTKFESASLCTLHYYIPAIL